MEAKEKDSVQKSHYKCLKCEAQYEDMDMDRIFDPMTLGGYSSVCGSLVNWPRL